MPANIATCFLQDKLGYMWFGTQNGLVCYDGYNLKVYNLETTDKKERANRVITTIFEDSKGILWIGTYQQGLFRFNRTQDNFTYFPHPSSKKEPNKYDNPYFIVADKEG
ncbi:ligand-binding sensor domain-containing protein [Adhaeribacter pallidiroseus]|uniref:Histidine kinase n=1 Tax=Adhaeribacter pallidiroseus TaxID=2072847 RepID=A0A369QEW2_9BACT|nr:two-component regulator propeller domain-containing protein [Adhaeribacter pallidiroseus]RDC63453.1 hypothetical protein AHMF7616_02056 [Adhaeribacter pallidiroseus]